MKLGKYISAVYRIGLSVFNNPILTILFIPITIAVAIFLFFLTPIINNVLRSKIYVFNMSALGHDVSEFIEFVSQLNSESTQQRIRLLYRVNTRQPTNNLFIFEIWKRSLRKYPQVTIHQSPRFFWSIILFFIQINRQKNGWLSPLTPNFSTYKCLTKSHFTSLINANEEEQLNRLLSQTIKNPRGSYCVLGIRDSGFYGDNSVRSSTIEDYLPSVEMLLELGTPVIRMGRRMLREFPIKHPLLFDYSFSEYISDRNDVLLWANAKFALGDSSGLTGVVGSFGSPIFLPTVPLNPRAFVSSPSVYFATQSLIDQTCRHLNIEDIVDLMNKGLDLGDERILDSLGLKSIRNSPLTILESLQWFLEVEFNKSPDVTEKTKNTQILLTDFMEKYDKDVYIHYRKDVLYSRNWKYMESHMWPQSVKTLFKDC